MKPLILASQSPRRKQLLEQAGLSFTVIPSDVEEKLTKKNLPEDLVASLAYQKALNVFERYPGHLVLGSDTVVSLDSHILGKPTDDDDARRMLQMLSGGWHTVLTGVTLLSAEKEVTFVEKTEVNFFSLSEEDISMYIKSGEPVDKAGAYGIQGLGAMLVEKINGDYFAIVGLPIAKVVRALKTFNDHV
ncbi:septum formation inhibitor Maf [Salipaludibacillus neizhouensis]|uniref:dTTP/UTP pyrophosphatase n=1 Tax=Salipaludibacillus neizhouensis TaxID=885475 RepID=A0A3A9K0K7_9BACI|nr:Maf family protein [Salipaludibacillus neizhouensis]RKL65909.1 septum formation inhibitor Maf [Salipaludibacillus neizhouensis]